MSKELNETNTQGLKIIFNGKSKYQKVKRIGKGFCGEIFKVFDTEDKKFYALKFISITNIRESKLFEEDINVKQYEKDIYAMKIIKNKYIIELKDYFCDEANEGYCIVMELCDGNLRQILKKYHPKGLPLNIITKIFIQLNEALQTMINKQFIHRDLKPENILIKYTDTNKNNFDIKLTDFRFSINDINSSIHSNLIKGTEKYMAPEIETSHYNNKCDLWSLGIILYELYTNKYIFDSNIAIEREMNRYKGNIVKETDNEMINKLIRKLIQVDIKQRIEWEEYFKDDFFKIKKEKENEYITELKSNLLVI